MFLSHQPLINHCEKDHSHTHSREHSHAINARMMDKKILTISLILTSSMMLIQFIYSLLSGSLALLSDSLHMFSDSFALALSLGAIVVIERFKNEQKSFGYFRLEVLVAFINALSIVILSAFIIYETIYKLFNPSQIDAKIMIIVALIGLVVNAISAFLMLYHANLSNLNIKSAFLHIISDLLGSAVVVLGGIFVLFSGVVFIDSILAIIISLMLLRWAVILLKKSVNILLESSPVSISKVKEMILENEKVQEIIDIHITQITENMLIATMHLKLNLSDFTEFNELSKALSQRLLNEFNIAHITIQPKL